MSRAVEENGEAEPPGQRQESAGAEIKTLLLGTSGSRPKNFRRGFAAGLGNVVSGAVAGAGMAILSPVAGAAIGSLEYGVVGGAAGFAGGAVVGVLGGAAVMVGGAVQGLAQVARGAAAVPDSVLEPRRGKWWNDAEGRWVATDLLSEAEALNHVPDDDGDILKHHDDDDVDKAEQATASNSKKEVNDTAYYNVLNVATDATESKIKRNYYVIARKCHPDRVAKDDVEAANKFSDAAEAYQVLSDPILRAAYDKEGKEGLSPDRTGVALAQNGATDPALLFAFLFGSDKFGDYVGRLAMASSAMASNSEAIGRAEARALQKRRVARLAVKLKERLKLYTDGDVDGAKIAWGVAAVDLGNASYGSELVQLIGKMYCLAAVQFLGSRDSGVGMPSISKWAKSNYANMKKKQYDRRAKADTYVAGMNMAKAQEKAAKAEAADQHEGMLRVMWTTTVVDVASTLHEAVQMVLFDTSADANERRLRGEGLRDLGEAFVAAGPAAGAMADGSPRDAKTTYEEAAFAAMLETVQRKEEAAFAASAR